MSAMDKDIEPVVTLELSLFEAQAVYSFLLMNQAEVRACLRHRQMQGWDDGGLKQPLLTTERALAKVKAALDVVFLETKRRWPRVPEADDLREDDE